MKFKFTKVLRLIRWNINIFFILGSWLSHTEEILSYLLVDLNDNDISTECGLVRKPKIKLNVIVGI